jgi:hypothetical protein
MALGGIGPNIAKVVREKGLVYRHDGTVHVWTGAAKQTDGEPYWWNPDNWCDGRIPLLGDSVIKEGETGEPWLVGIAWEDTLAVSARDYLLLGYMRDAPKWAKVA